jgi:hypothetical protein
MMDKTKERISAQETARFMDSQFGQLDLSGSPDLNRPPDDTFELRESRKIPADFGLKRPCSGTTVQQVCTSEI